MIFGKKRVGLQLNYGAKILVLLSLLLFAGCKPKFPSVPGDVIPARQMETIMIDMQMADAVAETKSLGDVN